MEGPTTPPRRLPRRGGQAPGQLHKRAPSKVTLSLTPATPPNQTRMSGTPATYRLVPESPNAPRIAPPLFRKSSSTSVGRTTREGMWTTRRIVVFGCVVVGLILLVGRSRNGGGYSPSWLSRAAGDEADTYGRAQAGREEAAAVKGEKPAGVDEHGRPAKVVGGPGHSWHPAPEKGRTFGGVGRPGSAPGGRERLIKVAGGRPGKGAAAADLAAEAEQAVSPAHNLEVTSATDPEASQKFLLIGWMGEQETKAQTHLYQLGLLSLALNRTLVLPGVKRSRFGTCYQNPFSLYYAADTLSSFGIPYISSDDFWSWTERQRSAPSAQTFTLARGAPQPVDTVTMSPKHMCLSDRALDFSQHEPVAFFSPLSDYKSEKARAELGEEVINALLDRSEDESTSSEDGAVRPRSPAVLVAHFNLRYPFLSTSLIARLSPYDFAAPAPYSYFPYSPHWTTLGHSIAQHLTPFVAVHWRTETLDVSRIAQCGHALVSTLAQVRTEHPEIRTLWLATDFPIEVLEEGGERESKATAHSGTMTKTLTPGHHVAMREFLQALEGEGGPGMRLTSFIKEQKNVEWPAELSAAMSAVSGGIEELDGAIVGIVDKIVLMEAELFYAGLPVSISASLGCGKLSQFTTQIISGRRDTLRLADDRGEKPKLWNEAGHFRLVDEEDAGEEGEKREKQKRSIR